MHSVSSTPFTPLANLEQDTAGTLNAAESDVQRKTENTVDRNPDFDGGNFRSVGSRCVEITLDCLGGTSGFFGFSVESTANPAAQATLVEVSDNIAEKKFATDEQNLALSQAQKRKQRRNNTKQTELSKTKPTDNQTAQATLVEVPDDRSEKEVATDQQHLGLSQAQNIRRRRNNTKQTQLSKTEPTVNQTAQATLVEVPYDIAEKKVATDQLSKNVKTQEQLEYKVVTFRKPKKAKAPRRNTNHTRIDPATYAKLSKEYADIRDNQLHGNAEPSKLLERTMRLQNEYPDFKKIRILTTIVSLQLEVNHISIATRVETADELYEIIKACTYETPEVLNRVYRTLLSVYHSIMDDEKLVEVYEYGQKFIIDKSYWESICGKRAQELNDTFRKAKQISQTDPIAAIYLYCDTLKIENHKLTSSLDLLVSTLRNVCFSPNFNKVSEDVVEKLLLLREISCANKNFFKAGMTAVALSEIYYIQKNFAASCNILFDQKKLETGTRDGFCLAENPTVDWTLAKRISMDGDQETSDALLNAAIKKQFGREYAATEATGNIKLDNIRLDGLKKNNCISEAVKLYHSMEKAVQFKYPFKLPYSSIEKVITVLLSRGEKRDQVLARKLAEELHKDSFSKRDRYYGVDISYAANKLSGENHVDGLFIYTLAALGDTDKAIYLLKQCDFFNEKIYNACVIADKPGIAVEILGKMKQLPISEPSVNYRIDRKLLHINKICYNSSDFRLALLLNNLREEYADKSKQNMRKTEIDWYYIHYLLHESESKYTEALDLLIENLPYVSKEMRKKYIDTQLYLCILLKDWGELEKIWKKERTEFTDNKVELDDVYISGKLKQYIEVASRIKSDRKTHQKKLESIQEETLRIIDEDMHITNGHAKAKVVMHKYQAYMLFGYSKAECDIWLEKCYQLSPALSVGERKSYNAAFVNIEVKNIRKNFHGIKD